MKAYKIQYKESQRARTIHTGIRFYEKLNSEMIENLNKMMEETFYHSNGVIVSIEETEDPRK